MFLKSGLKLELALVGSAALALVSIQGCSLFGPRFQGTPENLGFRSQASISSNPVPLPVEIVNDISAIASGGQIQQEGVWRPNYPEVTVPQQRVLATEAANVALDAEGNPIPVEEAAREFTPVAEGEEVPVADEATGTLPAKKSRPKRRIASGGKTETYKVRSGDTLMKISFEKFGNIYRWREIYDSNKAKIPNLNRLTAGTVLTIQGVEYVVIQRNGQPYLIRRGDTLVKISNKVYETPTEWKSIWKNNPQLISDPNKIYAGFTLYYVPKSGTEKKVTPIRQISSEAAPRKIAPIVAPVSKTAKAKTAPAPAAVAPVAAPPAPITEPPPATPAIAPSAAPSASEPTWTPSSP